MLIEWFQCFLSFILLLPELHIFFYSFFTFFAGLVVWFLFGLPLMIGCVTGLIAQKLLYIILIYSGVRRSIAVCAGILVFCFIVYDVWSLAKEMKNKI